MTWYDINNLLQDHLDEIRQKWLGLTYQIYEFLCQFGRPKEHHLQ